MKLPLLHFDNSQFSILHPVYQVGEFINVFFYDKLSLESVVMIFSESELWSSSFPGSIMSFTTRHGRLEYCSWPPSLFSSSLLAFWVSSNWVSGKFTLLSSAVILLFSSWLWFCSLFVLGVHSYSVVEDDVSGVGKRLGDIAVFWWWLPFFWEAGVVLFFFSFVLLTCIIFVSFKMC